MKVMKYIDPNIDETKSGPQISMWINSNTTSAQWDAFGGNFSLLCFPTIHLAQVPSKVDCAGTPDHLVCIKLM